MLFNTIVEMNSLSMDAALQTARIAVPEVTLGDGWFTETANL